MKIRFFSALMLALLTSWAGLCESVSFPPISSNIHFSCLWWSEAQMEGMDMDNPPPKKTVVLIEKWEYSDPVGVPHPNTVDVISKIKSEAAIKDVEIAIFGQWLVGSSRTKGSWSEKYLLHREEKAALEGGRGYEFKSVADIASQISKCEKQKKWPHRLKVILEIKSKQNGRILHKKETEFPVLQGN